MIGRTGASPERFQPSDLTPDAFLPRIDRELAR
jgi:hypothetical protein